MFPTRDLTRPNLIIESDYVDLREEPKRPFNPESYSRKLVISVHRSCGNILKNISTFSRNAFMGVKTCFSGGLRDVLKALKQKQLEKSHR